MAELDADAIEAVRNRQPIADDTLEALRRFTESVVESRGRVGRAELEAFEAAGYSRSQVFDVILGVAIKTLSNAVSGVTGIALDDAFEPFAWEAQAAATAGA
jgi:alkylhydroperoxidase family enzyme